MWIVSRDRLTEEQKKNNVRELYSYLHTRGWSVNAISALAGNMESESTINPGVVQGFVYTNPKQAGYGLIQWTASKVIPSVEDNPLWAWIYATFKDYDWDNGDRQCQFINTDDSANYYKTTNYNLTYSEFKVSKSTPEYLASAYLYNRERPLKPEETEEARRKNARKWYNFLSNEPTYYVKVTPSSAILNKGGSIQLTATVVVPDGESKNVIWTTDNKEMTVNNTGLVTVTENATGTATITATSVYDSSLKGTATITVKGDTPEPPTPPTPIPKYDYKKMPIFMYHRQL